MEVFSLNDDTQFLLSPGFGVDFRINEHVAVGTQMLFNIIPGAIHDDTPIDDTFYYSWEVIGLRFGLVTASAFNLPARA